MGERGVKVWVVEMLLGGKWEPCRAMDLSYRGAHQERRWMLARNPDDHFRVIAYVPTPRKRGGRKVPKR